MTRHLPTRHGIFYRPITGPRLVAYCGAVIGDKSPPATGRSSPLGFTRADAPSTPGCARSTVATRTSCRTRSFGIASSKSPTLTQERRPSTSRALTSSTSNPASTSFWRTTHACQAASRPGDVRADPNLSVAHEAVRKGQKRAAAARDPVVLEEHGVPLAAGDDRNIGLIHPGPGGGKQGVP